MKFCHIEESGGQQVLFKIDQRPFFYRSEVVAEWLIGERLFIKTIYNGTFEECIKYLNALDFNKEAYNFLTELASCM